MIRLFFFGFLLVYPLVGAFAQTISGTVFRDYNADGGMAAGEPGVAGITVTVFDASGSSVGTASTATDGSYSAALSVGAGTPVRVEFTGIPAYLASGPLGADSSSTMAFTTSGSTLNLGVHNPGDYCQAEPELATNCYIFGEQSTAAAPFTDVLVSFAYTSGNDGSSSTPTDYDGPHPSEASALEIGTTWGLAWQPSSESLFAAAYMKRHAGFGPGGPGAIYRVDRGAASVSQFLDLNALFAGSAGTDPHPFGTNFDRDNSWDSVGKISLGGMDLSDDGETLYVMNLGDRRLYEIPIGSTPTAPAAVAISSFLVPTPPGCATGDARPFAVKVHDGKVYVGTVCSAESTGLRSDLEAYVYAFDPTTDSFTPVLNFPLDYARDCANDAFKPGCNTVGPEYQPANWQPWSDSFTGFYNEFVAVITLTYPQPMLVDIEFDNGAMVLGLRDRTGDQTGVNAFHPTNLADTKEYVGITAGDILRACPDGMGGWTIESNGSCGGSTPGVGSDNAQGPGGGEFYHSEFYRIGEAVHTEVGLGGLALVPGNGTVLTTVFDPVTNTSLPNNTIYDAGVHHYNGDGTLARAYRVFDGPTPAQPAAPLFGKANGLGDLETLCDLPGIEIGNRVWDDINGNGIQDPGEPGLANIDITLFSASPSINVTIQTDSNGAYLFNSGNVAGGIPADTSFELRIDPADPDLGSRIATRVDNGSNDLHDSDGALSGGLVRAAFTTGKAGFNTHSYDFGFALPGAVGDYVWMDDNGDGVQDMAETGIENVTLDLIGDTNGNGSIDVGEMVLDTQTTDANGAYDFTGLLPGNYLVTVTDTNNVLTALALSGGVDPHPVALAAGQDYDDADFGYMPIAGASIGDFVWADTDGDGNQDGGEAGIGNVTLDLYDDANGNGVIDGGESVLDTQTTDGSGFYDFAGLIAGNYIVTVTDTNGELTGLVQTGGFDPHAVSLGVNQDYNDADFGYDDPGTGSIGDFVWFDTDGDGVQDAGESGIGNVTLDLIDDANGNGAIDGGESILATQTTDGSGIYDFTGLDAGNYIVSVTDTNGELTSLTQTGGTQSHAVSLSIGQDYDDADFGYDDPGGASIGDFVWSDTDGDGVQDAGETGIGNVTLDLYDDANGNGSIDGGESVLATQTTDGSGVYDFTGLDAGNYIVSVTDTNGELTSLTQTGGTQPQAVSLSIGQDYDDADFGYDDPGGASIGDFVWSDTDGDGVQDAGETGIGNVTLDLYDDANGNGSIDGGESVLATQTTDGSGVYDFTGLDAGNYIVSVTDTNGELTSLTQTGGTQPQAVSLSIGQDYDDADFGYDDPGGASIGDFVWSDIDGDGVQDVGEAGIANVTLDLYDDANGNGSIDGGESVLATQTTDGSGVYDFTGLDAGNYIVSVTDTNGELTSLTQTGGTQPHAVSLSIDQDYDDADFGYDDPGGASIGDFVWSDTDGDGVQDAGEAGIANVTLDLYDDANGNGSIDGGESVLATQTTDGSGVYDFTGLDAGNYIVSVTDTNGELTSLTQTGGTQPHAVSLSIGQDYDDADFGYDDPGGASIGDFVWSDTDGDGIQDAGEAGIGNVTLDLYDDANSNGVIDGGESVLATQTTDGSGVYDFTGLDAGNYIVSVTDTNGELTGLNQTGGTQPQAVSLSIGQDYDDADFGYDDPGGASIGDFVWSDTDGDGIQDAGETGIGNVTLDLYDDANGNGAIDAGESILATQTTDGSGNYAFTGLDAGDYIVSVTDTNGELTGLNQTGGTQPHAVSLGIGQDYDDADFGYDDPSGASIGDFVWYDTDGDSIQDAGETGIGNVTLDLIDDANGNGAIDGGESVLATQTTDGSGNYDFTGLDAGNYIVSVTDTNGELTGLNQTGGTQPHPVSLAINQDHDDADFGYDDPGGASIGDFVWSDSDGDGVQDAGETGIGNVTLDLIDDANGNGVIDAGESILATQTTNGSGNYAFTGLDAGNYIVSVTDTNGELTGLNQTGGTQPHTVTLVIAQDYQDADFGYDDPGGASIGDFVWSDSDGDGVQDAGETGIGNVTLDLYDDANGNGVIDGGESILAMQTTDGSGNYNFTGLDAGNYIVSVTDTNGEMTSLTQTGGIQPHAVSLSISQDYDDADFGYDDPGDASIGDFVWSDTDGDGVQDAGETGLGNVTLDLYDDTNGNGVIDSGESVLATQTTDGSGNYNFTGLDAGNYIVSVTDTNGELTGLNQTGGTQPHPVSLSISQDYDDADFGYDDPGGASIGDFVWSDSDGDGVQDAGESGIGNVTLDLYDDANGNGAIDSGESVLATQTTNGSGNYDFTGLDAGNYIVSVTDTNGELTGYNQTGGTQPRAVTLAINQDYDDADFGYDDPGGASIGDFVWSDTNGDGVQDAGETGIGNVTLDLYDDANGNGAIDAGESILATQTTDGSGNYTFTGLDAGDYIVSVTDTNGELTGLNQTGGTQPHAISLAIDQDYQDADFGYDDPGGASIGDFVWSDTNGDGVQDAGETGIGNVTLDLYDDANGNGVIDDGESVLASQFTNSKGFYNFTGLDAGNYIVSVTDSNNLLLNLVLTGGTQPHPVTLGYDQDYDDADFGYDDSGSGSIGDLVWSDTDGDGVQDNEESGIGNVTLDLIDDADGNGSIDNGETVLDTQTTDSNGRYQFSDLDAGDYLVTVTDTNGMLANQTQSGGVDPHAVSLTVGQTYEEADFGYRQLNAALEVTKTDSLPVTGDLDNDGRVDPGETLRYTVEIHSIGKGEAQNVVFTSGVGDYTTLSTGSVTTTQGAVTAGNQSGDVAVSVSLGTLEAGSHAVVTFDVIIDAVLPDDVSEVVCQGTGSGSNTEDEPSDDPETPEDDDPTRTPLDVEPIVTITKVSALNDDFNDNGGLDPGDSLEYTVVITNQGPVIAEDAVFTDILDSNTTLIAGTVVSGVGTVIRGNQTGDTDIEVDLGDMLVGEIISISFIADINDPLPQGTTQIINQGWVTGGNFQQKSSDDPNTTTGDDPTTDTLVVAVPTLGEGMLMVFIGLMLILSLRTMRRQKSA